MACKNDDPTTTIRILLVLSEDQQIILGEMFDSQRDLEIVGSTTFGQQAVELATELTPDGVIMDTDLADMSGITLCHQLTTRFPGTWVLMISQQNDLEIMRKVALAAAIYFLPLPLDLPMLPDMLRGFEQRYAYKRQFLP